MSSIRRPRHPQPKLRHLAFFEVLAGLPTYTAEWRMVYATLLTLRLADEWQRSGSVALDPAGRGLEATRQAIVACADDAELQRALTDLVDAMCLLSTPDSYALDQRLQTVAALWMARQAPQLAVALRA